jgi:translation initiation factor IF-3
VLDKVIAELKSVATLERPPIMEGRMITMIMSRAPGWEPPAKGAPQARDRKDGKDRKTSAQESQANDATIEPDPSPDTSEVAAEPNAQASAQVDAL